MFKNLKSGDAVLNFESVDKKPQREAIPIKATQEVPLVLFIPNACVWIKAIQQK